MILRMERIAMPEKRLQRRVGIEVPIQVYLPGSDAAIAARYQDLSWGGASFVTSDLRIQHGQRLIMRFPLDQWADLRDRGRCRAVRAAGTHSSACGGAIRYGRSSRRPATAF